VITGDAQLQRYSDTKRRGNAK